MSNTEQYENIKKYEIYASLSLSIISLALQFVFLLHNAEAIKASEAIYLVLRACGILFAVLVCLPLSIFILKKEYDLYKHDKKNIRVKTIDTSAAIGGTILSCGALISTINSLAKHHDIKLGSSFSLGYLVTLLSIMPQFLCIVSSMLTITQYFKQKSMKVKTKFPFAAILFIILGIVAIVAYIDSIIGNFYKIIPKRSSNLAYSILIVSTILSSCTYYIYTIIKTRKKAIEKELETITTEQLGNSIINDDNSTINYDLLHISENSENKMSKVALRTLEQECTDKDYSVLCETDLLHDLKCKETGICDKYISTDKKNDILYDMPKVVTTDQQQYLFDFTDKAKKDNHSQYDKLLEQRRISPITQSVVL